MVSQSHLQRNNKENHYILPSSTTAILSMAYVERATVGMRMGTFYLLRPLRPLILFCLSSCQP